MGLSKEKKLEIVNKFGKSEKDTGNTKVQVALLTERISQLTEHIKINKKDNHTRLGLLKMVGQRRHLLSYLENNKVEEYRNLIKKLGLRK